VVRPVAERVTRRRLAVIQAAFAELGHPARRARHYANAVYSAYLGTAALRRVDAAPPDSEDYIAALLAAFGVPAPTASRAPSAPPDSSAP
jgi:hypothetical protein